MKLDEDVRVRIVDREKNYLRENNVPFRFIKVRGGYPIIIVESDILYDIYDRHLFGDTLNGRYIAQSEKGWIAYCHIDGQTRINLSEKLTEVNATRFVLGETIGHAPRRGRYAMT